MPQQTADDPALQTPPVTHQDERRDKIVNDGIIVARVQSDVVTPGFDYRPDDIQRLIPVEWRDLDGHDRGDLRELPPERVRQNPPAHGGLQVEPHKGDDLAHGVAMADQFWLTGVLHGRQAQQPGVKSQSGRLLRLADRLIRPSADPGDSHQRLLTPSVQPVHLIRRQLQKRPEQTDLRVADGELRGVHSHGDPASSRIGIVAPERPLAALVQLSAGIQRQGRRRNGDSSLKCAPEVRTCHRALRSESACQETLRPGPPSPPSTG